MTEPIISVSGLRGIVGESLTPSVVARYVAAFTTTLEPGPVVVGRDGRESGPELFQAVRTALSTAGRELLYADIAATPTVGVLVRGCQAAGGVQITASHNPAQYNGLKLFGPEGRVLTAAAGKAVLDAYREAVSRESRVRGREAGASGQWPVASGALTEVSDSASEHLRLILSTIDVAAIRARRFRVLLDSNHGAGSLLGRRLLEALDCEVKLLGSEPNGRFAHPPEPTAENLASVGREVVAAKADIGFCQDPDADRLAIIDEASRYIGEEYTLALCVDQVLRDRKGPIVTNCATSRTTQDLAARHGVPFYRSAVGEANVVDKMLAVGAVFGGEGNGGPIDPRVGLVRDSFAGMALVLAAMAQRHKPVSALADKLPRYHIVKRTAKLPPERLAAVFEAIETRMHDARPDRLDGLRLDWPDRWLIVRGSNTEPIVRIIAEAPTAPAAEELVAATCDIISKS